MKTTKIALAALLGLALAACPGSSLGTSGNDSGTDPDAATGLDGAVDPDGGADAGQTGDCDPMEAAAEGPCAMELLGIKWNGEHCVGLGSGCECVGADCGDLYETMQGCVAARWSCYGVTCEPAAVSDDLCMDCTDEMYLGTFWDGLECYELWGCQCAGDGCDHDFASIPECEAVQGGCDSELCVATGGEWFPATPCGPCGHHQCGLPSLLACCDAGCNCGVGQTFVPGVGCQADPGCTPEMACLASDGAWHPQTDCFCGFTCGGPNDCQACVDSCNCGPFRNFDPVAGCQWDGVCGNPTEQSRCEDTGGIWHDGDGGCGHFTCGQPNLTDPCVMPGCDCGFWANFDSQLGCVWDDGCILMEMGQPCFGNGAASSCRPGLVCCNSCGVPPGCFTCQVPCCADNPGCEPNGCFPPPP